MTASCVSCVPVLYVSDSSGPLGQVNAQQACSGQQRAAWWRLQ